MVDVDIVVDDLSTEKGDIEKMLRRKMTASANRNFINDCLIDKNS